MTLPDKQLWMGSKKIIKKKVFFKIIQDILNTSSGFFYEYGQYYYLLAVSYDAIFVKIQSVR